MNLHDIRQNPDEHVRFAAHLEGLRLVPDADEADLVGRVLTDPDQVMAQSAVLRHVDRRAADLCPEPAYDRWSQQMNHVVGDNPVLTQRLRRRWRH
ncbi:hypothetical protein [Streptacidiphilus melanogenes]|uniref:hypothetical protein n=1 Tax=Streptacidiphilus melanogenes TaxID=411235 RepID=UPI000693779E|nr:hypothetical protein [Streptacidiphilus melanogenes]